MPERIISTYLLLGYLTGTRLLTRVRVLFLLILPLPASYHGKKNLDFEENIVDTNAYVHRRADTPHSFGPQSVRADKGRHYRLLLHAASPTPLQAEYWPRESDALSCSRRYSYGDLDECAATLRGTR